MLLLLLLLLLMTAVRRGVDLAAYQRAVLFSKLITKS
jgi:hypothetical protein